METAELYERDQVKDAEDHAESILINAGVSLLEEEKDALLASDTVRPGD